VAVFAIALAAGRWRGGLALRRRPARLALPVFERALGIVGLFLADQSGLQQLIAQGGAHDCLTPP
jgi:hypothetical protein